MSAQEAISTFEAQGGPLEKLEAVRHLADMLCSKLETKMDKGRCEDAGNGYIRMTLSPTEAEQILWLASNLSVDAFYLHKQINKVYSALVEAEDGRAAA
ncbi:hypothetical protein [Pelagibacterium sediminicola]|uniref:hypothetical protein n=1 Tax=Pelagibacterium sediminicola TaxID=2248761 RepID=UPI000E31DA5B|nr:hypothetical protein [Pelagibacterium sediminicola]